MSSGPPAGRLDRTTVLAAALEIVDEEGLELLTMRRLADRLSVDPMTLYRHARNKDDLLDGVTALVYEAVHLDVAADDWRSELHRFAGEWRSTLLAHPQVIPLLAVRPLALPLARRPRAALDLTEQVLTLLDHAGFEQDQAIECYRAIVSWLIGAILTEVRPVEVTPGESEHSIRLGFQHLPTGQYDRVRQAADRLASDRGAEGYHTGLEALIQAYVPSVDDGSGGRGSGPGLRGLRP